MIVFYVELTIAPNEWTLDKAFSFKTLSESFFASSFKSYPEQKCSPKQWLACLFKKKKHFGHFGFLTKINFLTKLMTFWTKINFRNSV